MLAVVGYLVQEAGVRLPGNIDYSGTAFADIPNGFAAFKAIPLVDFCSSSSSLVSSSPVS